MSKKILIVILIIIFAIGLAVWALSNKKEVVEDENLKIVTSFYPIYIMTANIIFF